ncbi:MAG: HEAT repeat domain-containing protein [Pirellulaceae bacterium]|nr:HEAT repeat domain-containing protein [Pirellulaceae bacterium]
MHSWRRLRRLTTGPAVLWLGALLGLGSLLVGCKDGPVPEMRTLNPWIRKEWAEDEQFGPTFYQKVADLKSLRGSAGSLAPAEQERISQELAATLREESSSAMRIELVRALGEFPTETARSAIAATLADELPQVRQVACTALGRHLSTAGIENLGQVIAGDADLDVRITAARELGRSKDPAAAQALRVALDDRDAGLQGVAMASLRDITGRREYANSAQAWREFLDGGNPQPPPPPTIAESLQQVWNWY